MACGQILSIWVIYDGKAGRYGGRTEAALLKLTQANIASINRVREAALRFQIKQAPLSESAQEEVQAILDSCDDSLRQMILFEETVKQKF